MESQNTQQTQTFAALVTVVDPSSGAVATFNTSRQVHAFALAITSAVALQAFVHI